MPLSPSKRPRSWWEVGTRLSKRFGELGFFDGEIRAYDAEHDYYHIVYQDGDEEDLDTDDIEEQIAAGDLKMGVTTQNDQSSPRSKKKKKQRVQKTDTANTNMSDEEQEEEKKEDGPDDNIIDLISSGGSNEEPETTTTTTLAQEDTTMTTTSRRGRRRKSVQSYRVDYSSEEDDSDSDDDEDEEAQPRRKTSRNTKKSTNNKKKNTKKKSTQDDSDFESEIVIDDDDDESLDAIDEDSEDDVVIVDEPDDDDVLDVSSHKKKPQKKRGGRKTAKAKSSNTTEKPKEGKTSMAEAFKPINYPCYQKPLKTIHEEHEFLDPCGMEATDDVIDHLVGDQVLKIGKLLQRTLDSPEYKGSHEGNPLQLGTACSGTDAPALALTIVQEQMERFQWTQTLHYQHQFSCEKEPFKQVRLWTYRQWWESLFV